MSDSNNIPPSSDALERTLNEILASELVLEGRNGRQLQSTVEGVVADLLEDGQLQNKLQGETKVGFGMALGKFLAWKVWTEIEKSDKRKTASKTRPKNLTLRLPEHSLAAVKEDWPLVRSAFLEKVGFALVEPTLEVGEETWSLEIRGGLLESRPLPEDWFQPLVQLLVEHAPRLLSLSMVKELVDEVRAAEQVIGEEMERLRLPLTAVYRVLESLLEEAVPIHEMETILTAIVLNWEHGPDRSALLSAVRRALSPWICKSVQVRPGVLRALKMGRRIEEMFANSVRYLGSEQVFDLEPQQRAMIAVLVKRVVTQLGGPNHLVLLTNHRVRQEVRAILRAELPALVVLSDSEIHRGFGVEVVAVVDFREAKRTDTISVPSDEGVAHF